MEIIIRFLGFDFAVSVGPTTYDDAGSAHLGADTAFGFAIDPLNVDKYWEDED